MPDTPLDELNRRYADARKGGARRASKNSTTPES